MTFALSGITAAKILASPQLLLALRTALANVLNVGVENVGTTPIVTDLPNVMALRALKTRRSLLVATCTVTMTVTSTTSAAAFNTLTSGANAPVIKATFTGYFKTAYTAAGGALVDLGGIGIEGVSAVSVDSTPTAAPTQSPLPLGLGLGLGLGGGVLLLAGGLYYHMVHRKKAAGALLQKITPMQEEGVVIVKTGATSAVAPLLEAGSADLAVQEEEGIAIVKTSATSALLEEGSTDLDAAMGIVPSSSSSSSHAKKIRSV